MQGLFCLRPHNQTTPIAQPEVPFNLNGLLEALRKRLKNIGGENG